MLFGNHEMNFYSENNGTDTQVMFVNPVKSLLDHQFFPLYQAGHHVVLFCSSVNLDVMLEMEAKRRWLRNFLKKLDISSTGQCCHEGGVIIGQVLKKE